MRRFEQVPSQRKWLSESVIDRPFLAPPVSFREDDSYSAMVILVTPTSLDFDLQTWQPPHERITFDYTTLMRCIPVVPS
jgi:hypothetical protein